LVLEEMVTEEEVTLVLKGKQVHLVTVLEILVLVLEVRQVEELDTMVDLVG
jgi:hypothetical protein